MFFRKKIEVRYVLKRMIIIIDLLAARTKRRLDGPALSGHLLYSLVSLAFANRYHYHLVW